MLRRGATAAADQVEPAPSPAPISMPGSSCAVQSPSPSTFAGRRAGSLGAVASGEALVGLAHRRADHDLRRCAGGGGRPALLLIDEAGRTAIPSLADHATTVVGRGISLWIAIQSLSQLEAVYGRARARVLRDNMDTQVFYRPSDLETAEFLERSLGRRSGYAHSESVGEGSHTSEGLSEQAVPLMTAQAIKQMADDDIIGFHRGTAPFRAKRMDWRDFPELGKRRGIRPPQLPALPALKEASWQRKRQPVSPYFDPDALQ